VHRLQRALGVQHQWCPPIWASQCAHCLQSCGCWLHDLDIAVVRWVGRLAIHYANAQGRCHTQVSHLRDTNIIVCLTAPEMHHKLHGCVLESLSILKRRTRATPTRSRLDKASLQSTGFSSPSEPKQHYPPTDDERGVGVPAANKTKQSRVRLRG
jgi:hypothetical protein